MQQENGVYTAIDLCDKIIPANPYRKRRAA